jgi:hypothetical protein
MPADHGVGVGLRQRAWWCRVLALGRPLDKKRGSPTYVNVINIHNPDP